jgi:hypothetical protein
MRHLRFAALAALVLALPVVTGCSDDDDPTRPTTTARVMAVHASPDAPAVDLLVDGTVQGSGLAFPNNTAYLTVGSGTRNLKVRAAGTTTVVIDANVPFTATTSSTVFAVDSLSKISAVVLSDDLTTPAAGKAHVRFVHLSPNAPAVDVGLDGGAVVFPNRAFKEYTAFTPLDAGVYDLEVRVAGTSTVALDLDPITLQAGKIYTVWAKGFLGGAGAQALGAQIIANN